MIFNYFEDLVLKYRIAHMSR